MPLVDINVSPVPTADWAAWLAHGRKTTPVSGTTAPPFDVQRMIYAGFEAAAES